MTLEKLRADGDWREAFTYACNPSNPITRDVDTGKAYTRDDVKRIVGYANGENDGPSWVGLFEMTDGRYLFLAAHCDYTGWDCQAGGAAEWTSSEAEALACLPPEVRARMFPGKDLK